MANTAPHVAVALDIRSTSLSAIYRDPILLWSKGMNVSAEPNLALRSTVQADDASWCDDSNVFYLEVKLAEQTKIIARIVKTLF